MGGICEYTEPFLHEPRRLLVMKLIMASGT